MHKPKGFIKFSGKKCVMKPFDDENGLIETWEITDNPICKEFFSYKGNKYKLISSVEKKNK